MSAEANMAEAKLPGPTLVLLPDPEARTRLALPLMGIPLAERMTSAAHEAGFSEVVSAPGLAIAPTATPTAPPPISVPRKLM